MCGRFVISKASSDLVARFKVDEVGGQELGPSWNVAPTQKVNLVAERLDAATGELSRRLETVRWGLVPVWARDRNNWREDDQCPQ